jgi:hypothetical protein
MKKIALLLAMLVCGIVFAVTATNGSAEWIYRSDDLNVVKITIPLAGVTDDETVTWDFNGMAMRVVVDVTNVDADGDITIKDVSGTNYVSLTDKLGSGDVSYIIPSEDADGNVYGGVPVAVTHTMQLVNCAAAAPIYIYVYYKK